MLGVRWQTGVMSTLPPPPPPRSLSDRAPSVPGGVLATAGARIGAALLDGLLAIVTLGIGWIIWSVVLWKDATSPAKKMLGMRIVDANTGAPATMNQMVMREAVGKWVLGYVTGIVSIASCVMLFTTPKRQAVWDYVATTVVVRG